MPLDHDIEARLRRAGYTRICGLDEAGRGPLAGPVVAAAVVFADDHTPIAGIDDSKKLKEADRERLYPLIVEQAAAWAVAEVSAAEIDEMNILRASLDAMRRAAEQLVPAPDFLLIDGNQPVPCATKQESLVKGDSRCYTIAAASILAKVHRDRLLVALDAQYPAYGFAGHKGYPTRAHREAIAAHGPCPEHRRTFRGVKEFL